MNPVEWKFPRNSFGSVFCCIKNTALHIKPFVLITDSSNYLLSAINTSGQKLVWCAYVNVISMPSILILNLPRQFSV